MQEIVHSGCVCLCLCACIYACVLCVRVQPKTANTVDKECLQLVSEFASKGLVLIKGTSTK